MAIRRFERSSMSRPDYLGWASRRQPADIVGATAAGQAIGQRSGGAALTLVKAQQEMERNTIEMKSAAADLALRKELDPLKVETSRLRVAGMKHDQQVKGILQSEDRIRDQMKMKDLENVIRKRGFEDEILGREASDYGDKFMADHGAEEAIANGDAERLASIYDDLRDIQGVAAFNAGQKFGGVYSKNNLLKHITDPTRKENMEVIFYQRERQWAGAKIDMELDEVRDGRIDREFLGASGTVLSQDVLQNSAAFASGIQDVNDEIATLYEDRTKGMSWSDTRRIKFLAMAKNLRKTNEVLRDKRDSLLAHGAWGALGALGALGASAFIPRSVWAVPGQVKRAIDSDFGTEVFVDYLAGISPAKLAGTLMQVEKMASSGEVDEATQILENMYEPLYARALGKTEEEYRAAVKDSARERWLMSKKAAMSGEMGIGPIGAPRSVGASSPRAQIDRGAAVDLLRSNPTAKNKAFFLKHFDSLPDGM